MPRPEKMPPDVADSIDVLARHAIAEQLSDALVLGRILHENYGELTEEQFESVLEQVRCRYQEICPSDDEFEQEYGYLVSLNDDEED